jgi:hypothetical protein
MIAMILGGYIAYKTLYDYELIVKLTLTGLLLFLLYREFFNRRGKTRGYLNINIKLPKDLILIPYALLISVVVGWAFKQFFDALFYVIYRAFEFINISW